jgi:nucleoside-diphosphate-sugar epimerase
MEEDINIYAQMPEVLKIKAIYHLAAVAGVGAEDAADQIESNILGTVRLAKLAAKKGAHLVQGPIATRAATGRASWRRRNTSKPWLLARVFRRPSFA